MSDQYRAFVAAECRVQRVDVGSTHERIVRGIGRDRRRRITTLPGGNDAIARRDECGREMAPRVRRIGKAVQTKRERPVCRAAREVGEAQTVRVDERRCGYFSEAA